MSGGIFNAALVKEQLKRFWVIAAFPIVFYVLFVLSPIWFSDANRYDQFYYMRQVFAVLLMQNPIVIILSVVVPLSAAAAVFSYMFVPNSASVMHALPFSKKQLFASNALTGYILIIVPVIVFCVLFAVKPVHFIAKSTNSDYIMPTNIYLFPNGLQDGAVINTVFMTAGLFLRMLVSVTFYYILFIFAVTLAGNAVIHGLVSVSLPFVATGLYLIYNCIATFFRFGFYETSRTLGIISLVFNPVAIAIELQRRTATPGGAFWREIGPYYAGYVVIMLVVLALAVFLYHKRQLEHTGESIVFTPVENIYIMLLSIGGMIFIGAFCLNIFRSVGAMYAGCIFGFLISFLVALMIAEKSFYILGKMKRVFKFATGTVVLFGVVVLFIKFDVTGYVKFIPNAADVEGVYLFYPNSLGDITDFRNNQFSDKAFVKNPQAIERTLDIHRTVLADKKELYKVFLDSLSRRRPEFVSQRITYLLKNGKTVTRSYLLPGKFFIDNDMQSLYNMDDVVLSYYCWLDAPELVTRVNYWFDGVSADIVKPSEIASLMPEIKKDILAEHGGVSYPMRDLALRYTPEFYEATKTTESVIVDNNVFIREPKVEFERSCNINVSFGEYPYNRISAYAALVPGENTKRWMKDNGYVR